MSQIIGSSSNIVELPLSMDIVISKYLRGDILIWNGSKKMSREVK